MHVPALLVMFAMMHGSVPRAHHHGHVIAHHAHSGTGANHARMRRIVYYSPLKGSHDSLLRQNVRTQQDDLQRIQDDTQLEALTSDGSLVSLPESRAVTVDERLPEERRFCRPWTRSFVEDLGEKFYAQFKSPLKITSAVRTADFQEQLRRHNGNAAPEDGDTASPHLTGASLDIAKSGMTRKQLTWARSYLLNLQNSGLLDAEEEFRQHVFHVTVYRDYMAVAQPDEATINPHIE